MKCVTDCVCIVCTNGGEVREYCACMCVYVCVFMYEGVRKEWEGGYTINQVLSVAEYCATKSKPTKPFIILLEAVIIVNTIRPGS